MSSPAQDNAHPSPPPPHAPARSGGGVKRWVKFALRWGIAVLGIWWVLSNLSWHDRVMIADPADGWPVSVKLVEPADEDARQFKVEMPDDAVRTLRRDELLVRADAVRITLVEDGQRVRYDPLARKLVPAVPRERWPLV